MQSIGASEYTSYLVHIAANEKVSDASKLCKELICIPVFEELSKQDREKKDKIKNWVFNVCSCNENYPIRRLLYANLCYMGHAKDIFRSALVWDDISLARIALNYGADPNEKVGGFPLLYYCKSEEAVKLMFNFGADISKANYFGDDPITWMNGHGWTSNYSTPEGSALFSSILSRMPLDNSNEHGLQYMKDVMVVNAKPDHIISRVKMLLERGCKWDDCVRDAICRNVENRSSEKKEEIEQLFDDHDFRKRIKGSEE